jgi:hypothetical protein
MIVDDFSSHLDFDRSIEDLQTNCKLVQELSGQYRSFINDHFIFLCIYLEHYPSDKDIKTNEHPSNTSDLKHLILIISPYGDFNLRLK